MSPLLSPYAPACRSSSAWYGTPCAYAAPAGRPLHVVISLSTSRDDTLKTNAIILCLYGIWEFFPLILLLATVASGE